PSGAARGVLRGHGGTLQPCPSSVSEPRIRDGWVRTVLLGIDCHRRNRQPKHRQPSRLTQKLDAPRGPARYPLGLRLVAMPAHAAGLVRVRNGDKGLACRAAAGRHENITGDVPRVAIFSNPALEHGYGIGEEQYRNRLTLRGARRRHRAARSYLSAAACRMAVYD